MTMKMPHRLKTLEDSEVSRLNQNVENVYSTRLESLYKNVSGTATTYLFQSMETGEATFSATGSATITRSFAFKEKQGTIIYAQAHARSNLCHAAVTDVTGTSITIDLRTISGTAAFSAVTSASIIVGWMVVGSNP